MPLDHTPQSRSLQCVAGSHKWGKLYESSQSMAASELLLYNFPLEKVPDIDSLLEQSSEEKQLKILSWELNPGDCIVFHMNLLHGASGNESPKVWRRVLSTRWLGDDASFARQPQAGETPAFPGLVLKALPNAPLTLSDVSHFPLVWN